MSPQLRLAIAPALLFAVSLFVNRADGSGMGISVAGDLSTTASSTDTLFFQKKPGGGTNRFFRDLEFELSSRYSIGRGDATPGLSGDDLQTLISFGRTLTDSVGKNPFGAPYSDFHLAFNYFSPTSQRYDSDPTHFPGFTLPISDGIYSQADKAHMDSYLFEPGQYAEPNVGGRHPSSFSTAKEDSSTGHWRSATDYEVLPLNSLMVKGPIRSLLTDVNGAGWTRPGQAANWIFIHEFQHALSRGSGASDAMEEFFSTGAEVLSGDLPSEAAVFDYAYTWSLLASGGTGNPGAPRSSGANYAGYRLLAAYLLYNYRNEDTTATLSTSSTTGGFADDLLYRWARKARNLSGLQTVLSNDSCYTCSLRPSFNPGGVASSTFDRLQLLVHQMRVASFVNNAFLDADASGYGPYGFPRHFGFSPSADVGAWRDNDPNGLNVVVFPQEVTARPAWVSRDTTISKDRSRDSASYPLVLQPYGAEYWVIRSKTGLQTGTDLVVRVASDSLFRWNRANDPQYCFGIGAEDGRLMATVVGYTQQADDLWNHPEYAGAVLGTQSVDVDSLGGEFVFTIPNFGTTYRAALLVITLEDGPSGGLLGSMGLGFYHEAVRYRLNLGLRKSPYQVSDPAAFVESSTVEDYPTWSPDGNQIAYETAGSPSQIRRKWAGGGPDSVLVTRSESQHTPDWSPRGDRVAFAEDSSTVATHIFTCDHVTQQVTKLTFGSVTDMFPVYQPNAVRLAYVRSTGSQWTIRLVNADGGGDATVLTTALSTPIVSPRWSPEGQTIYFVSNGRLYSVPASGGTATPQDGLGRGIASFDLPAGNGRMVLENADSLRWYCLGTTPSFMPYRRIALRDTLASPKDTEMRWYRTGASYFHPRYSFDNTRVAYRSDQNSVGGGDLFLGQAVYDHAPNMSAVVDTVVGEGIGFSIALPTTDSDGDALAYSGAYMPAGSNFLANLFSWSSPTTAGSPFYVVLRAVSPGGAVGSKVVKITVLPRPEPPNDLIADAGRHTAAAAWTEPTQPSGQADSTQVRYTVNTPITEQNFATAAKLGATVTAGPAETMHCVEDSEMVSCRSYYFAAKTWRNGIPSTISNVATASTMCSGYVNVSCGDFGLWGGGGGGGSLRTGGTSMASIGQLSSASQSPMENSLLGGIPGDKRVDLMKIPTAIEPVNDQLLVLVRKSDGEEFTLGQVALFAVDHASGEQALSSNDRVLLGTTTPVDVIDGPADALAIEQGGTFGSNGLVLERNEVVTLDLSGSPTPQALVIEASLFGAPVVRDSAGIAVQVPDGADGWRTLDLIHPRRLTDRQVVELAGAQRARIVALGRYTVRGIQGLLVSGRPSLTPLVLADATHSSTGDVKGDISESDSRATTIRVGDSVELAFTAPPAVPGMVRDLFLFASGAGTSATATAFGYATMLVSAAPSFVNALGAARPNPTTGRVTISYTLAAHSDPRMSIYNVAGRLVRTLVNETQESGPHEVTWDGLNDSGAASNAGVYFYRLQVGTWTSQQKFVVLER